MLRLVVPDSFVEERRYILQVLLGEFLGLPFSLSHAPQRDYWLHLDNGSSLCIEDHFFSSTGHYLHIGALPQTVSYLNHPLTPEGELPVLFGTPTLTKEQYTLRCSVDLFASAFFMLTRWEEYVNPVRDQHQRFPATASTAYRFGFLHRPIVNEYTELLWNMLVHLGYTGSRRSRQFEWVLTHDVDEPFRWRSLGQLTRTAAGALSRGRPLHAFQAVKSFVESRYLSHDPYNTFSHLMEVSEALGTRSHFYFMGGGKTRYDTGYSLKHPQIQQLVQEIDARGHQIGFHPSYNTAINASLWHEEWEQVQQQVPFPSKTGRQHYLRFDVPTTWQIWEEAQMTHDSTLGYANHEGFRCGVCEEFPVFNILSRQQLKLRERPLLCMENTLVQYRQLSPEEAENRLSRLIATVKRYRGQCVLLWHNSSFNTPLWQPYQGLYAQLGAL